MLNHKLVYTKELLEPQLVVKFQSGFEVELSGCGYPVSKVGVCAEKILMKEKYYESIS